MSIKPTIGQWLRGWRLKRVEIADLRDGVTVAVGPSKKAHAHHYIRCAYMDGSGRVVKQAPRNVLNRRLVSVWVKVW